MRRMSLAGVLILAAIAYGCTFGRGAFAPQVFNFDFVAFYCAGEAVNAGADPYLTEPLRSCEHRVGSFRKGSVLVVPAPLPAYDLGVFRLVAKLPFAFAAWSWFALVCAACAVAMLVVIRLGRFPPLTVVAGMTFPLLVSAYPGQLAPFAILGVLVLARAFAKGSAWWAFAGALLAATEPHLGAFAVAASLVWGAPRVRAGSAAACALLATASVLVLPLAQSVEYVRVVLPLHALSEINNQEQYGLSYVLHRLGNREAAAVHASGLAFVCALLVALASVARLRRALSPELAILAPSAALLAFAPFLHITQIAIAEPAALLLWRRTGRSDVAWAVLLLALPWIEFAHIVAFAPLAAAAAAVLAFRVLKLRPTYGLVLGALAVALCALAGFKVLNGPHHTLLATTARATSPAEVSWREAVDLNGTSSPRIAAYAKLPTYAGLLIVAWSLLRAARARPATVEREHRAVGVAHAGDYIL